MMSQSREETILLRLSNFYFYNSFYVSIEGTEKIDYTKQYSLPLYIYYKLYSFTIVLGGFTLMYGGYSSVFP
ncbi:MAG: hypothetical protein ABI472_19775 [Ginsengibacter sp.]